ncbi:hypothetical protein [Streptomyces fuscichromogenes]|uniref:Uncharacterized protein n=1 Tax=Streptomyces fuscichromogenes TaxID=1324013 RepID=A0A917XM30_9ACTN|nr:hypothetical protein [Streptomyces fuscichromogenes]GGN38646.1 hypothetical protein GCM10011578_084250 [Streptomyces fuscichromogenes]
MGDDVTWQCLISEPEGGIRLPLGENAEFGEWAKRAARQYLGTDAPRSEMRELASALARVAATADLGAPTFAYAYVIDAAKALTAVYEVHDYDGDGYRSPDRLPGLLETVLPTSPERRSVTEVNLPAGPGVRVQELLAVETGSLFKKKTMMETVTYAVIPPQVDNILAFRMSWTNLVFSEALLELAQTLAESLELTEVKEG